jgi:hypothetical protein
VVSVREPEISAVCSSTIERTTLLFIAIRASRVTSRALE